MLDNELEQHAAQAVSAANRSIPNRLEHRRSPKITVHTLTAHPSFALVRLSALGDVTLTVPLVRTLRAAYPGAKLTWITSPLAFALLDGLPGVEFIVVDKPRTLRDYRALARRLRGRKFDAVLALQASLRINLIYPFISADIKLGFDRQRAREGQWLFTNRRIRFAREHLVDSFLAFGQALGVKHPLMIWDLPLGNADLAFADQQLAGDGPFLAVNPAASKAERNWTVEGYLTVLRAAQARWKVHVVLTGGSRPDEIALGMRIAEQLPGRVINLIGKTTPKQLAAALKRCDCLLAPDTGPVHIAVAVGTPVVGLYAVAPPELSGPYFFPDLIVDKYPEAVRTLLRRDPEKVPWNTRVHHPEAMALIQPDDVLEKLELVFGRCASLG